MLWWRHGETALWWLSHVLIGAEQISQSNGLVAVWARAAGADPPAALVAVRAALLAQEACAARGAAGPAAEEPDGDARWPAGRRRSRSADDRSG